MNGSTGSYPPLVQLTDLHTPVWWGGVLALLGLFYVVKFRPGTRRQVGLAATEARSLQARELSWHGALTTS